MAMHKLIKYIRNPFLVFPKMGNMGLLNWVPDEEYLKLIYWSFFHEKLNLKEPLGFNAKIQWLKLYDRDDFYTKIVDKVEVKHVIEDRLGKQYIIPTLGVWNSFDDIDFESLPKQFVIKCSHDSCGNVIVRDKSVFDMKTAKKKIERALKTNYFYSGREWPYRNVPPRILVEQYMENDLDNSYHKQQSLIDYKFYCFDGKPRFLYVSTGLENHDTASISFVSLEWKKMPFYRTDYKQFDILPEKPKHFDEMIDVCNVLAKEFRFVRVDLYEINNKVYFSELTLHPCSGLMSFNDKKYDLELGRMLNVP